MLLQSTCRTVWPGASGTLALLLLCVSPTVRAEAQAVSEKSIPASVPVLNGLRVNPVIADLIECQLVLRGEVLSTRRKIVDAGEFGVTPWDGTSDSTSAYLIVTFVEFRIDEVMKGEWEDKRIIFAVDSLRSDLEGTYRAGDALIVGLEGLPYLRDAMFSLKSGRCRLVRSGDRWEFFPGEPVTLDAIRSALAESGRDRAESESGP
jgi:hypothetical protein